NDSGPSRNGNAPNRNGNAPSDSPLNCDLWASSQSRALDLRSRTQRRRTQRRRQHTQDGRPKSASIPQICSSRFHVDVGSSQSLTFDNADAAYDLLAEHVERFIEAWDSAQGPPALMDYVPHGSAAVRR